MTAREHTAAALARVAARWSVRLDGAPACSPSGCVAFGRLRATDAPVVLKVAAPGSDEALAGAALRHFDGHGSVRVLRTSDEGACLMERVLPGDPLVDLVRAGRDDEATAHLCDVAAALHARPLPDDGLAPGFPTVARWGVAFDRWRDAGRPLLPAALVTRAAATFSELVASQGSPRQHVLLHGDLQHFNVLRAAHGEPSRWLAIDPKGVIGEPAYEFGAMLRNPAGEAGAPSPWTTTAVADRRSRIVAERLGHDRARVLAWAFAQAALSAVWSWEDGESPDHALAVARAIAPIAP